MHSHIKSFLTIRHGEGRVTGNGPAGKAFRMIHRSLLVSLIALLFSMALTSEIPASDISDAGNDKDLDTRWLPWIGSWSMVSSTINMSENSITDEYFLNVSPRDDGNSVSMKGYRDQTVISEEKVTADGLRHPLTADGCTGWSMYSWSETGKRLLLNSESRCQDDLPHIVSGMSIIDDTGEWLEIRLLKIGEEKVITISRYGNLDDDQAIAVGINATDPVFSRISAGTGFSINEIIELSSKVEPEVLEAALVELHKSFPINSKQLARLADSEVPSQIVDLMVALSFPERFTVEKTTVSMAQKTAAQESYPVFRPPYRYWPYEHPFYYSWYWDSHFYSPYDYWHLGWNTWPSWYYPYRIYPHYWGGTYERDTGRLVEGSGYTRINPVDAGSSSRYARPRNSAPLEEGTVNRSASGTFYGTSSSVYSSGSSGRSSSGSSGKTPCASPGGYSSGDCEY